MPTLENQPDNLLRTILEHVGVAIAIVDSNGNFVFANDATFTLFGMSGLPRPVHLRDWASNYQFHDTLGHEIAVESSAAMRTLAGEHVEPQDLRIKFADGRIKWVHTSAHPFSVIGLTGVLVILTDETEEIELRRATAQLKRMEDVRSMTLGLAHNFNNILDAILMNVELALDAPALPETTSDRLEKIKGATWKAAELVKRLMRFSRIQEVQAQTVQINSLVNEVLTLVRPMLSANVQVQEDLAPNLPEIEADPSGIEQVLVNLIVNARDAMPEGGVLTIATELEASNATANAAQQFVLITVLDTGVGIQEEIQPRIFDPFFTTKAASEGVGLGLSSAYAIVRQHHGEIKVQSGPGKGTKFTIRLPVEQAKKNHVKSATPQIAA